MNNLIIGILIFIIVVAIAYIIVNNLKKEEEQRSNTNTNQGSQYAQNCKDDWLCATTTILAGAANVAGSISLFGNLFNNNNNT